mmetsp:Transcript_21801/g.35021  ORF Transcript_21801/g.35021 Transcript_21801/m.35021 type:complete len:130 (+) Transcript_21801:107-496(+)
MSCHTDFDVDDEDEDVLFCSDARIHHLNNTMYDELDSLYDELQSTKHHSMTMENYIFLFEAILRMLVYVCLVIVVVVCVVATHNDAPAIQLWLSKFSFQSALNYFSAFFSSCFFLHQPNATQHILLDGN